MAVVRELENSDTYITYLSTIALFCGISCTIVMLRFKGFKASLNLSSGKTNGKHYDLAPQVSVVGAYRTSKEEYFGNINYLEARKTITPSMVKLPPSTHTAQTTQTSNVKSSKSTSDLTTIQNVPTDVQKSTPNVCVQNAAPSTKDAKNQLKAQKKLEKERMIEQKKKDKLAAQEREKEEKIRKEREKQAAQQQAKEAKEREKQRKKKCIAPRPQQQTAVQQNTASNPVNPPKEQRAPQKREAPQPPHFHKVTQRVQPNANPLSQRPAQNSRNSLESSISRSSGPPPYTDIPEAIPNSSDNTGNTSFAKPVEASSWDLISQHRQQMSRTTGANIANSKQRNMDLRYNVGNLTSDDKDNSEV